MSSAKIAKIVLPIFVCMLLQNVYRDAKCPVNIFLALAIFLARATFLWFKKLFTSQDSLKKILSTNLSYSPLASELHANSFSLEQDQFQQFFKGRFIPTQIHIYNYTITYLVLKSCYRSITVEVQP